VLKVGTRKCIKDKRKAQSTMFVKKLVKKDKLAARLRLASVSIARTRKTGEY